MLAIAGPKYGLLLGGFEWETHIYQQTECEAMTGHFKRSWNLMKQSFSIIGQEKELLVFPILSGLFSIAFLAAMVLPSIILPFLSSNEFVLDGLFYLIGFAIYFGLAFIATFFNVATVNTAKRRFAGESATFFGSIAFAFSRIHVILLWSLLAASVGILLRLLDNLARRLGPFGRVAMAIVNMVLGLAWSIMTIFVVPVLVYENLGPFAAIKRSLTTLKKTWGEAVIGYVGLGFASILFYLLAALVGGVIMMIGLFTFELAGLLIGLFISIALVLLVGLIFNAANKVYLTALYVYATTGQAPSAFSAEELATSVTIKDGMRAAPTQQQTTPQQSQVGIGAQSTPPSDDSPPPPPGI